MPASVKGRSTKRRLFVGTFLPTADMERVAKLRDYDTRLGEEWRRRLRWVRAEKLHLTWLFIGYVESESVDEVVAKLDPVLRNQKTLEISYEQAEFWPSAKRARNFVVTPYTVPSKIKALAAQIKSALEPFLQGDEHKGYRPHITLLRLDDGPSQALTIPEWFSLGKVLPLKQKIQQIALIESHMGKAGDSYEPLAVWDLTP